MKFIDALFLKRDFYYRIYDGDRVKFLGFLKEFLNQEINYVN